MKTRKILCICLAVIAVIAVFTGAIRLRQSDANYQRDSADARQQIENAQTLTLAAERLGQMDQTYTAGAPTHAAYDDPMFTAELYEMVDAYSDEGRLYSGLNALAAMPEMQGAVMPGASCASVLETAASVYTEKLQAAEETWHHAAVSNGILLCLGLLGLALSLLRLHGLESEVSEPETQTRRHHRPHTPAPHLT